MRSERRIGLPAGQCFDCLEVSVTSGVSGSVRDVEGLVVAISDNPVGLRVLAAALISAARVLERLREEVEVGGRIEIEERRRLDQEIAEIQSGGGKDDVPRFRGSQRTAG